MFGKKQTVGQFLFDYIHKQGVNHAFGIPGDFVLPTFRWLEKSPIKVITMTHEPSVGFAADCYARSTGLGLAVITYCVGGLNMLNAIACAYAEKSPVIVISGGPSPKDRHKDPMVHHKVRTFDTQRRIFEEVTCANTILLDPETAASEIVRVVEEVKKHKRPGYIEVPFDVVDMQIAIPTNLYKIKKEDASDAEVLESCISEIITKINNAKKPVILAGEELHRFGLTDIVSKFATKNNIPIAATLLGKSVIRETNPLYLGIYNGSSSEPVCKQYVDSSDCVLVIGAILSDMLLGFANNHFDRKRTIILNMEQIQVGMHIYEEILLKDVLANLHHCAIVARESFVNPNPPALYRPLENSHKHEAINVESMFRILSTRLGEGSSVVCDTGDALMGAMSLRTDKRSHFFADAYYLSMGFAMPAAIGAIYANPASKVYAIIGDGAFQMTGIEISTIAKYGLAPVVIIINNDGYGTQRHILDGEFNNIRMWDYTKICELIRYGKSVRVTTKGQLDEALLEAATYNELYLIEVVVPKDDCSASLKRMGEGLRAIRNPEAK
jgi:indolepyruvate decarboxylase